MPLSLSGVGENTIGMQLLPIKTRTVTLRYRRAWCGWLQGKHQAAEPSNASSRVITWCSIAVQFSDVSLHTHLHPNPHHTMADELTYLLTPFAKTPQGMLEIQTRSLGLSVLARRVLILVDGNRTGKDLGAFVAGSDILHLLEELLSRECIAPVATAVAAPAAAPAPAAAANPELADLPPAQSRSAKDVEMARNFMTNTVNTIFGHHNRISLIEAIHACQSSEDLRRVYVSWAQAMEGNATGKKRLPELREKLFAVL